MFRNVIFDWSGTLCNDLPPVIETINRILTHHGVPEVDELTFRTEFRLPFGEFYAQRIPGVSHAELEALYVELFKESKKSALPIPHAREFIEAMRATDRRLFLLSAVTSSHFHEQAELLGFKDCFERLYLDVRDKRHVIREILEENRIDPAQTCFIGDMCHDIDTAKHAGITSIAVLTGYDSAAKLAVSEPNLMVAHLGQLLEWFDRADAFQQLPVCTVGALISNSRGEVLLLRTHKWSHRWGIPGGKIKWGESRENALRREIREETGLEIANPRLSMIQDCVDPGEYQEPAHFVILAYTADAQSGEVRLNDEAEEFVWLEPRKALDLKLNEPTRRLLRQHAKGADC